MNGAGTRGWGGRRSRLKKEGKIGSGEEGSKANVGQPPEDTFPSRKITPPKPLSQTERAEVAAYRRFRECVHNGPLYTVLGDDVRVNKYKNSHFAARKVVDAFDGVETYSQRYTVRKRQLPKLDTRPYVRRFFPKELWNTVNPKLGSVSGTTKPEKKRLQLSSARLQRLADETAEASGTNKAQAEDGNEGAATREDEPGDDVIDDAYDTDDDDMAGDYNAEAYFDDGEEDIGDDHGDGGDGGDGYY